MQSHRKAEVHQKQRILQESKDRCIAIYYRRTFEVRRVAGVHAHGVGERTKRVHCESPNFPPANASGNFAALATARTSVAREIIQRRKAVGLSQKALSAAAGARVGTLNRIENGKMTADNATITRIDRVLTKAENRKP